MDGDLQGGVAIRGEPFEPAAGTASIEYEGTDGMNLPVTGSASCTFAVGDAGTLTLTAASAIRP